MKDSEVNDLDKIFDSYVSITKKLSKSRDAFGEIAQECYILSRTVKKLDPRISLTVSSRLKMTFLLNTILSIKSSLDKIERGSSSFSSIKHNILVEVEQLRR